MRTSHMRFIRQQGFTGDTFSDSLYRALMVQPQMIGALTVVGMLLQSAWLFLALAVVLWWSALVPTRNPFDAIYNHVVANRGGLVALGTALAPRRFAAAEAGTVACAAGIALLRGATVSAWIIQGVLIGGVISAVVFDFCIGAYTYELLRRLSPRLSAISTSKG